MKDVTNKTPVLLVGGAMFIFKKMYRGNIYRLENTDDAKDFIERFYNIEYNKPIVVEDISLLYRDTILLKLVEEIKLPLILLASEDNISNTLQSRIKTYIKYPVNEIKCSYNKILESLDYINQNDLSSKDLDIYISNNCPELARLNHKMKLRKNKDKLQQILGSIIDNKSKT
jgi:hypothetical protein